MADDHADAYARNKAMSERALFRLHQRYGFPAQALTTNEVQRRMEGEGIDKWHARLVSRQKHLGVLFFLPPND